MIFFLLKKKNSFFAMTAHIIFNKIDNKKYSNSFKKNDKIN